MSYLKCLGIFFLVYCSVFEIVYLLKHDMEKRIESIMVQIVRIILGVLLGGLWIFLLYKIMG